MNRRIAITIVFALLGAAILVSLGVWQLQRHQWKQGVLARIDATIGEVPVALPAAPHPERHAFLPVRMSGIVGEREIRVQSSLKLVGAGYRIVAPFETDDGRRILVDRGFVRQSDRDAVRPGGRAVITGNLHWPDELDAFTPDPDPDAGLWFARDLRSLADRLDTEAVLVVVRESSLDAPQITRLPLDSAGIPDNHLGYAIQWFLLAAVWATMSAIFVRGQRRANGKGRSG